MTQPKFSVTNQEILKKYSEKLKLEGKSSKCIIGVIGDEFMTKSGGKMIPIKLYQVRTDATPQGSSSDPNSAEASLFFRGWGATVLSNIENVDKSIFDSMNFQEGQVLEGWNLQVCYTVDKPFWKDQEPLINPVSGEIVTSENKPLYRDVITVRGEAEHIGLNIERDESIFAAVSTSDSLEETF